MTGKSDKQTAEKITNALAHNPDGFYHFGA